MPLPCNNKNRLREGIKFFPPTKQRTYIFYLLLHLLLLKVDLHWGLFLPSELQVESPVECVEYEECDRVCDLDSPLHGVGQPLLEVRHVWVRGPGGRGARRGDGGRVAVATGAQLKKERNVIFVRTAFFASELKEARYIFFLGGKGSSEMI